VVANGIGERAAQCRLPALILGGLLLTASPAAAKTPAMPAALKGKSCAQVPYRDRTQAPHNAAGLIFVPHGDKFRVRDSKRDNYLVDIWFNYAVIDMLDVGGQTLEMLSWPSEEPCVIRGTMPPGGGVPLHSHADAETGRHGGGDHGEDGPLLP
jgi:hypothetical protein